VAKTRQSHGLYPRSPVEDVDIDEAARRQCQSERITTDLCALAELAPQNRERPAQRSQGIGGLGEEQARNSLA
jgi:hypothetical protein